MKRLWETVNNSILKYDLLVKLYSPIKPHIATIKALKFPFKETNVGVAYLKGRPKEFNDIVEELTADNLSQFEPPKGSPYIFNSEPCKQAHFSLPLYQYWCIKMNQAPEFKRKQWEFVYIIQCLYERGLLNAVSSGVGFGVGKEPLVSLFASKGCDVLATDISEETGRKLGWVQSDQHTGDSYDPLWIEEICSRSEFKQRVSFRHVDMNDIPDDIQSFDFCWSACAFEHLGSIKKGLEFVEKSLRCIKPGGLAVHTSEYNLSSNENTQDDNPYLVLFRQRDYKKLFERLESAGHKVYPVSFEPGEGYVDNFVDIPPYYRKNMHLNLLIGKYVTTSFGLVIRKAS